MISSLLWSWKSKIKELAGSFWWELSSRLIDGCLRPCFLTAVPLCVHVPSVSSSYKDTGTPGSGPYLVTSINCICSLKGSVSKYSLWELKLQHMNLRGGHNSICNMWLYIKENICKVLTTVFDTSQADLQWLLTFTLLTSMVIQELGNPSE